jgi:S1-C subfamily serine protease
VKTQIIIAALSIFFASDCLATELHFIGKQFPGRFGTDQPPSEIKDWNDVSLDGLSGNVLMRALSRPTSDEDFVKTRGRKDVQIYRNASSAVVMVMTTDEFGSGTYLGSGRILTNWHVVKSFKSVGVLFKPQQEGSKIDLSGVIRADVVQTDPVRDLALLKVALVPPAVRQLTLGSAAEVEVGADVLAIGHPTGEAWTFTKGLISQVRNNYEWSASGRTHRANVIQTQTPINPGNSGGPLISESGKLLGVNSFKESGEGLEGLNFAVSVIDVMAFLNNTPPGKPGQTVVSKSGCKPMQLYNGRDSANEGKVVQIDANCDGVADFWLSTLDDVSKPISAFIDSNFDGKIDIVVEDTNRDNRWDVSFHDVDFDGNVDLIGYHPDGKITPSRFEKYASAK